jgi:ribosomal protein S27AE
MRYMRPTVIARSEVRATKQSHNRVVIPRLTRNPLIEEIAGQARNDNVGLEIGFAELRFATVATNLPAQLNYKTAKIMVAFDFLPSVGTPRYGDGVLLPSVGASRCGDGVLLPSVSTPRCGDGVFLPSVSTSRCGDGVFLPSAPSAPLFFDMLHLQLLPPNH